MTRSRRRDFYGHAMEETARTPSATPWAAASFAATAVGVAALLLGFSGALQPHWVIFYACVGIGFLCTVAAIVLGATGLARGSRRVGRTAIAVGLVPVLLLVTYFSVTAVLFTAQGQR